MSRFLLPLVIALLAAAPVAGAQATPPRDTIRIAGEDVVVDTLRLDEAPDTVVLAPRRGQTRWAAPFAVESSGRAVPRRARGEVVWMDPDARPREAPLEPSRVDTTASIADEEPAVAAEAPAADDPEVAASEEPEPVRPTRRVETDASTAPTPARARPRTHTVVEGETLFGIARRYNVTTAQLRVLNPAVEPEALDVGSVIRLPATARMPGAAPAAAPAEPRRAPAARRTHTVARGETLFGLARRYQVSADAIIRANDLPSDQLRTGQVLVIP